MKVISKFDFSDFRTRYTRFHSVGPLARVFNMAKQLYIQRKILFCNKTKRDSENNTCIHVCADCLKYICSGWTLEIFQPKLSSLGNLVRFV